MAYIANTAFEVVTSNVSRENLQNVTGKFGSFAASTFTPDICSAGFICTEHSRLPNEGYEDAGILNDNSWYMVAATSGNVTGLPGDHTGLYVCNTYDVNRASDGVLNFNFPGKALGIATPAGERANFTEIRIGESYAWGAGNFSTAPSSTLTYATIVNGLLVAQAAAPTDGSVYFQIYEEGRFTEGPYDAGVKYYLKAFRSVASGG